MLVISGPAFVATMNFLFFIWEKKVMQLEQLWKGKDRENVRTSRFPTGFLQQNSITEPGYKLAGTTMVASCAFRSQFKNGLV